MITAIPEEQAEAFAILRRPQVPTDLPPQDRWELYATGRFGQLGLNPALARRAQTPLGDAWVICGDGWIGLDVGGMTANTTQNALAGRVITWTRSRSGPGQMVQGLVPDTITEVQIVTSDGSTTLARVADNTYGVDLGSALLAAVRIGSETILRVRLPDRR